MRKDLTVKPIAGACSAEKDDINLPQPMDDGIFYKVDRALLNHRSLSAISACRIH
tara:strand:+ start:257 stop:421 length:165 start_codon:yes stop_codon:yes gene_type:complete